MVPPKHIVSAAAIVLNEYKEILLIKGPKKGWKIPGGKVEEGESLKDATIRETKEECGLDIEVTKFCGVFHNVSRSKYNTLFLGTPIGGELTTSSESLEVGFFPIEKAVGMVTWINRQKIEYSLNEKLHPFYLEF